MGLVLWRARVHVYWFNWRGTQLALDGVLNVTAEASEATLKSIGGALPFPEGFRELTPSQLGGVSSVCWLL